MSEIKLHPTSANCITCVPDYFIDNYMVEADGEFVKIYLYILRSLSHPNRGFCISQVADALDHTQKDIRRALKYWEKEGLLKLEYDDADELCGIYLNDPEPIIPELPIVTVTPPISAHNDSNVYEFPTPVDQELKQLLYVAEMLMGHPLSADAVDKIVFWHENMNLPWDLIEYIIEYSAEKGADSIQYMDKVAVSYANSNIYDVEEAKSFNLQFSSCYSAVKKAFGLSGRSLAKSELKYIKRWSEELGFSDELIEEACNRTILKTHTASFDYADSILNSWKANSVTSIEGVNLLDAKHDKNKINKLIKPAGSKGNLHTHNFPERSNIDYQQLETTLLQS